MRKFIKKIFITINIILVLLTLFSIIVPYFNPFRFEFLYFPGLFFPLLIILNIIFCLLWLFLGKKWLLLSLIVLLFSLPITNRFYRIRIFDFKNENINGIKLISYNVRMFNYYDWINDDSIPEKIYKFIKDQRPDLLCIQEFSPKYKDYLNIYDSLKVLYPYQVVEYPQKYKDKLGLAIFSKYPLKNTEFYEFSNSANGILKSDLIIDKIKLTIVNVHLQSTNLNKTDFYYFDNIFNNNGNHIKNLKSLAKRLKEAYLKRITQVDTLTRIINRSNNNIIVCGDFNDTPISYTYHQINKLLNDAFIKVGRGSGTSYIGRSPGFRIDYVFVGKNILPINYQIKSIKYSDHYPILFEFVIKNF